MSTTTKITSDEQERAAYLLDAQTKAASLFDEIERDLVRPGITEKDLSNEIHDLGRKRHNVRTDWHKRVVRSGPNTLLPYAENPPDRTIETNDILFVDLGPRLRSLGSRLRPHLCHRRRPGEDEIAR